MTVGWLVCGLQLLLVVAAGCWLCSLVVLPDLWLLCALLVAILLLLSVAWVVPGPTMVVAVVLCGLAVLLLASLLGSILVAGLVMPVVVLVVHCVVVLPHGGCPVTCVASCCCCESRLSMKITSLSCGSVGRGLW